MREEKLCDPNPIYRALDKLIKCGLVHRLESLIAFAICDACGQAEEFSDTVAI